MQVNSVDASEQDWPVFQVSLLPVLKEEGGNLHFLTSIRTKPSSHDVGGSYRESPERNGEGSHAQDLDSVAVSQRLQKAMLKMTGNFLDETTGKVNYASLRSSEEYRAYCAMAGQLRAVD
ncbi:hypothetical protein C7M84_002980, partial [Penaeus vannamei]